MTNQQLTNFQPHIQKNTDNKLLEREGASHPEQHKAPKNINNWLNLEELSISVMLTVMHMIKYDYMLYIYRGDSSLENIENTKCTNVLSGQFLRLFIFY